jgi:hypothetical protein
MRVDSSLASAAHVAAGADGAYLDAKLVQVEPATNTDKFYSLQVLEHGADFYVYSRWGRTGGWSWVTVNPNPNPSTVVAEEWFWHETPPLSTFALRVGHHVSAYTNKWFDATTASSPPFFFTSGTGGQNKLDGPDTFPGAAVAFEKQYKSKTGFEWANRQVHKRKDKKGALAHLSTQYWDACQLAPTDKPRG